MRDATGARALDLLVDAVSAYRITKLATDDELLSGPRGRIVEAAYVGAGHHGKAVEAMRTKGLDHHRPDDWNLYAMSDRDAPKFATLMTCRWCAGMYVAAAVIAARAVAPRAWPAAARLLTAATAAALLAGLEG